MFDLRAFAVAPGERIFGADFNLAAVPDEVDAMLGFVEISLNSDPTENTPGCFDNVATWTACWWRIVTP